MRIAAAASTGMLHFLLALQPQQKKWVCMCARAACQSWRQSLQVNHGADIAQGSNVAVKTQDGMAAPPGAAPC